MPGDSDRNIHMLIFTWFSWLKTTQAMHADREELLQSAPLKIPAVTSYIFDQLERMAHGQLNLAQQELSTNKIRILSNKYDQGEYFVIWQQRGKTDLSRYDINTLAPQIQENMNLLFNSLPPTKK